MKVTLTTATMHDAPAIATLRCRVAERLTRDFGQGHWSSCASTDAVLRTLRTPQVYVARRGTQLAATLRLATKKPWAIDTAYFTNVKRVLYLLDMAVEPDLQRQDVGRQCLEEAARLARVWPSDAIRLDAYDAEAGAGEFYTKCGYREVGRVIYRNTPLVYYELLL